MTLREYMTRVLVADTGSVVLEATAVAALATETEVNGVPLDEQRTLAEWQAWDNNN